jgi:hypothetical protein
MNILRENFSCVFYQFPSKATRILSKRGSLWAGQESAARLLTGERGHQSESWLLDKASAKVGEGCIEISAHFPELRLTSQGFALISLRDIEARSQEPEAKTARA